jgi:hypothetical protein
MKCLSQLSGPKLHFPAELVEPVLASNSSDLRWMEERLGERFREDLADSPDVIRTEEDLLKFDEESLRWLAEQLGPDHIRRLRSSMPPEEIAQWVHELRLKLSAAKQSKTGSALTITSRLPEVPVSDEITFEYLVQLARDSVPELKNVRSERAAVLMRHVFKEIASRIESMDEGSVTIAGLGNFRVRKVEQDTDSKGIVVKRIVYNPKRHER